LFLTGSDVIECLLDGGNKGNWWANILLC
jgi:hypothetical protein